MPAKEESSTPWKGLYSPLPSHAAETYPPHQPTPPRAQPTIRLILELLIALLLLAILTTLLLITRSTPLRGPNNDPRVSSGPFTHLQPYGRNLSYFSLAHTHDYLWTEALHETYSELEFPPFSPSTPNRALDRLHDHGAIAMLHALHCLAGMRRAIQRLGEGTTTLEELQDEPHVPHCFDYLRQTVLCFADDTLERPRGEDGEVGGETIEGAYDVRVCRDSERLLEVGRAYGIWMREGR